MDTKYLLDSLNEEITKLNKVRAILSGEDNEKRHIIKVQGRTRGFTMSAEARKRIGDAQRARWSKQKQAPVEAEKAAQASPKAAPQEAVSSSKPRRNKKPPRAA